MDLWNAENKKKARTAAKAFAALFGAKFPKAVAKITDDLDQLLAFYDYPAEHWIHLRTTNPIESTFSTVRLRTKVTKGAGRRRRVRYGYKLIESAQRRWRVVNAPHLVALVRAGRVVDGKLVGREEDQAPDASTPSPTATSDELADAAEFLIDRYHNSSSAGPAGRGEGEGRENALGIWLRAQRWKFLQP